MDKGNAGLQTMSAGREEPSIPGGEEGIRLFADPIDSTTIDEHIQATLKSLTSQKLRLVTPGSNFSLSRT